MNKEIKNGRSCLVHELYALGFTYNELSLHLRLSLGTVRKYLNRLRSQSPDLFSKRPTSHEDRYVARWLRYAELKADLAEKSSDDEMKRMILCILRLELEVSDLRQFVAGVAWTVREMLTPYFSEGVPQSYLDFLFFLFPDVWYQTHETQQLLPDEPNRFFQDTLMDWKNNPESIPRNSEEAHDFFLRQYLYPHRPTICGSVMNVEDRINAALNKLPDLEKNILQMFFGLNGSAVWTHKQIGLHLNVSKDRERTLFNKAVKYFQRLPEVIALREELNPMDARIKILQVSVAIQKIRADEAKSKIAGADDEQNLRKLLSRRCEELPLSNRTVNSLKRGGLEYLYQVVPLTRKELKAKCGVFGKKSLDELEDILAEIGLSLGMQIEKDVMIMQELLYGQTKKEESSARERRNELDEMEAGIDDKFTIDDIPEDNLIY